jgi:PST family polysaccharide transporter
VNLLKTSFYTSISTAITFISGLIVIKVVAIKIGPQGMAYLGQFQNTTAILSMLATGAITTGVIKYLAEYREDEIKKQQIINTSFVIVACSSFVVSLFVMGASGYLSEAAFKTRDFWIVYFLFGLFTMAVAFNVIFSAILNGLKEIRKYTIVNICASLIGVAVTISFSYYFGVTGVLVSSSVLAVILLIINIFLFKQTGIKWRPDFRSWDRSVMKLLFGFSLMAVVSGFLIPSMQILVRNKIITGFSLEEAGYWQAVTRISDYYLAFITTVLSVYYMPRLSEIQTRPALRAEIFNGYKVILPVVGILALLIWVARSAIVHVLFTPVFLPMRPLFTYQLLGDFFKIGSWLLAYLMLAKALVKIYIVTEILFAAIYVALCYFFLDRFGLIGATYGFCATYALYWIVMAFLMRKSL